jgi:hypothetical protein
MKPSGIKIKTADAVVSDHDDLRDFGLVLGPDPHPSRSWEHQNTGSRRLQKMPPIDPVS